MSFRMRLSSLVGVLSALLLLYIIGLLTSPERLQSWSAGQPLLPDFSAQNIDGISVTVHGERKVQLRRTMHGWEAPSGARIYPASTDKITTFLRTVVGLVKTNLVSKDVRHLTELGLSAEEARTLVFHPVGRPDIRVLVGKRGPSGDADYVQVQGQESVYLVRGALAFFLAQEPSYWYELHVLPDDVQSTTIAVITVRGSLHLEESGLSVLRGGYTLKRPSAGKQDQWVVGTQQKPADRVAAGAMASSLAMLEGVDFVETPEGKYALRNSERLEIVVSTFEGKEYSISIRRGPEPGKVRITTDWSPWTYLVNDLLLQRAVLAESVLTAAR
jgi:hypothetical protein